MSSTTKGWLQVVHISLWSVLGIMLIASAGAIGAYKLLHHPPISCGRAGISQVYYENVTIYDNTFDPAVVGSRVRRPVFVCGNNQIVRP